MYNAFAAILTTIIALPWSSLAVTEDAFCYLGRTHVLYQQQRPFSVLLVYCRAQKTPFAFLLTANTALP